MSGKYGRINQQVLEKMYLCSISLPFSDKIVSLNDHFLVLRNSIKHLYVYAYRLRPRLHHSHHQIYRMDSESNLPVKGSVTIDTMLKLCQSHPLGLEKSEGIFQSRKSYGILNRL